jgi:GMP synthase (glutamine-hydrolysing)
MQLMAHCLGGRVGKAHKREYGKAELVIDHKTDLFNDIPKRTVVWMSHGTELNVFHLYLNQ